MSRKHAASRRSAAANRPAPARPYAGFSVRLGAFLIDALAVAVIFVVLTLIVPLLVAAIPGATISRFFEREFVGQLLVVLVPYVLALNYFPASWAKSGQTIGMRLFRLKLVPADDKPISTGRAWGRLLGLVLAVTPLGAGLVVIVADKQKQGWHDKIAQTFVVQL